MVDSMLHQRWRTHCHQRRDLVALDLVHSGKRSAAPGRQGIAKQQDDAQKAQDQKSPAPTATARQESSPLRLTKQEKYSGRGNRRAVYNLMTHQLARNHDGPWPSEMEKLFESEPQGGESPTKAPWACQQKSSPKCRDFRTAGETIDNLLERRASSTRAITHLQGGPGTCLGDMTEVSQFYLRRYLKQRKRRKRKRRLAEAQGITPSHPGTASTQQTRKYQNPQHRRHGPQIPSQGHPDAAIAELLRQIRYGPRQS